MIERLEAAHHTLKRLRKLKDEAAIARAEARLDKAIEQAMAESGLTQYELANLFVLK